MWVEEHAQKHICLPIAGGRSDRCGARVLRNNLVVRVPQPELVQTLPQVLAVLRIADILPLGRQDLLQSREQGRALVGLQFVNEYKSWLTPAVGRVELKRVTGLHAVRSPVLIAASDPDCTTMQNGRPPASGSLWFRKEATSTQSDDACLDDDSVKTGLDGYGHLSDGTDGDAADLLAEKIASYTRPERVPDRVVDIFEKQ